VDRIITDLCVLDVTPRGFELVELAPGVKQQQITDATDAAILTAWQDSK
jgi:3-oxoacid CoA-transferase subunit B